MSPHPPLAIVPGIDDSGPGHWQSLWEASYGGRRLAPSSWSHPEGEDWVRAVSALVRPDDLVAAHSMGCLAVTMWLARGGRCAGALLVAPPDPAGPGYPPTASGFSVVPLALDVPLTVVGSTDDPYGTEAFLRGAADLWGASYVSVGARGHVNAASGLGEWPEGWALLQGLRRPETPK